MTPLITRSPPILTEGGAKPQGARAPIKELANALRSDDLAGARSAYAEVVRQAPDGASYRPGSDLADLGKALGQGDVDAAKVAFGAMVRGRVGGEAVAPAQTPGPYVPAPTMSTTGGSAGTTFSAVA